MEILDDNRNYEIRDSLFFYIKVALLWGLVGGLVYGGIYVFVDYYSVKYHWNSNLFLEISAIGVFILTSFFAIKRCQLILKKNISILRSIILGFIMAILAFAISTGIVILYFYVSPTIYYFQIQPETVLFYLFYVFIIHLFTLIILSVLLKKNPLNKQKVGY